MVEIILYTSVVWLCISFLLIRLLCNNGFAKGELKGFNDYESVVNKLFVKFFNEKMSADKSELKEAIEFLEVTVNNEPCRCNHHGYCEDHIGGMIPCYNNQVKDFLKRINGTQKS